MSPEIGMFLLSFILGTLSLSILKMGSHLSEVPVIPSWLILMGANTDRTSPLYRKWSRLTAFGQTDALLPSTAELLYGEESVD